MKGKGDPAQTAAVHERTTGAERSDGMTRRVRAKYEGAALAIKVAANVRMAS
jgi:hypothetical protein